MNELKLVLGAAAAIAFLPIVLPLSLLRSERRDKLLVPLLLSIVAYALSIVALVFLCYRPIASLNFDSFPVGAAFWLRTLIPLPLAAMSCAAAFHAYARACEERRQSIFRKIAQCVLVCGISIAVLQGIFFVIGFNSQ